MSCAPRRKAVCALDFEAAKLSQLRQSDLPSITECNATPAEMELDAFGFTPELFLPSGAPQQKCRNKKSSTKKRKGGTSSCLKNDTRKNDNDLRHTGSGSLRPLFEEDKRLRAQLLEDRWDKLLSTADASEAFKFSPTKPGKVSAQPCESSEAVSPTRVPTSASAHRAAFSAGSCMYHEVYRCLQFKSSLPPVQDTIPAALETTTESPRPLKAMRDRGESESNIESREGYSFPADCTCSKSSRCDFLLRELQHRADGDLGDFPFVTTPSSELEQQQQQLRVDSIKLGRQMEQLVETHGVPGRLRRQCWLAWSGALERKRLAHEQVGVDGEGLYRMLCSITGTDPCASTSYSRRAQAGSRASVSEVAVSLIGGAAATSGSSGGPSEGDGCFLGSSHLRPPPPHVLSQIEQDLPRTCPQVYM